MRSHGIKAQDIVIILKLITTPESSQMELSQSLKISQAEISHALKRLKIARLILTNGMVQREACLEFFVHGLKYVFPVEVGAPTMGVPTAHAKPGFKFVKQTKNDIYVWPHPMGHTKGVSIRPLYPTLPEACLHDEKLYTLASLIEMIRIGRVREQQLAAEELQRILEKNS